MFKNIEGKCNVYNHVNKRNQIIKEINEARAEGKSFVESKIFVYFKDYEHLYLREYFESFGIYVHVANEDSLGCHYILDWSKFSLFDELPEL